MKRFLIAAILIAGCTTTTTTTTAPPPQPAPPQPLAGMSDKHGLAGWYGQEFAGRTTANGEIFDPLLMTAAHRSLPFGTIVDVKNPKTQQTVRVRVNDRGPYIGNRLIDLSYAAAQQIGIVDTGGGEVDINVVRLGKGEREPPAPYTVAVTGPTAAGEAPRVEVVPQPAAPAPPPAAIAPKPAPVTVDNVQVIEEHKGVETRRQVSASGQSVEVVPVPQPTTKPAPVPAPAPVQPQPRVQPTPPAPKPQPPTPAPTPARTGGYVVQVGAFSVEANAKALQERLAKIGEQAWIDKASLWHVRFGPFETKEQAIKQRERLERAGISAIIVTP
jgi:rare lipoprotein A